MAHYEVTRNSERYASGKLKPGKRIQTNMKFKSKAEATKYAKATNEGHWGANARIVKIS